MSEREITRLCQKRSIIRGYLGRMLGAAHEAVELLASGAGNAAVDDDDHDEFQAAALVLDEIRDRNARKETAAIKVDVATRRRSRRVS